MKYYVRDWGRPCGIESKVFTSPEEAEAGDGCYCEASVVEFDTEAAALAFIKTKQSAQEPQLCFDHGTDLDPKVSETCPMCKSGEVSNDD